MPSLKQSQLQRVYRPLAWMFLILVMVVFGSALYAGSSSAVITITPLPRDLRDTREVIIGPNTESNVDLDGVVTVEQKTAAVTAAPSSEGVEVPARAHGAVTLHNETSGAQALAVGTRLQSEKGVIVRTTTRSDVPAHGTVDVEAIADESGVAGELPPGRLTIVALRQANQSVIYGQVVTAFTGGQTRETGRLSVDALTKASNDAQQLIEAEVGRSQSGRYVAFVPDSVVTDPKPEEPSDSYRVTVTLQVITATYDAKALDEVVQSGLVSQVGTDEELARVTAPTLIFEDQPRSSQVRLTAKVTGQAMIHGDSKLIQPAQFGGLTRPAIEKKLLGTKLVSKVTVKFAPWWQRTVPKQSGRTRVVLEQPGK